MNKLLQSIKAGELEFDKKFLYKLNQTALRHMYPELYADQLDFLRSNTIKLLEEQIAWLEEGKFEYIEGDDGFNTRAGFYNQSLDETTSMLRETIKELTNQSHG